MYEVRLVWYGRVGGVISTFCNFHLKFQHLQGVVSIVFLVISLGVCSMFANLPTCYHQWHCCPSRSSRIPSPFFLIIIVAVLIIIIIVVISPHRFCSYHTVEKRALVSCVIFVFNQSNAFTGFFFSVLLLVRYPPHVLSFTCLANMAQDILLVFFPIRQPENNQGT